MIAHLDFLCKTKFQHRVELTFSFNENLKKLKRWLTSWMKHGTIHSKGVPVPLFCMQ